MAYVEEMQGVHYDEFIGSTAVPVIKHNVTLAAATAKTIYKKGTLLARNASGKYEPCDASSSTAAIKVASAVLAEDITIETKDMVATVYVSGMFNREKLVAASGDTVDAHEVDLRDVGILLTSIY
nr:MAG TPA_asm: Head decoration protein [Caudoviricetes sp.]